MIIAKNLKENYFLGQKKKMEITKKNKNLPDEKMKNIRIRKSLK